MSNYIGISQRCKKVFIFSILLNAAYIILNNRKKNPKRVEHVFMY